MHTALWIAQGVLAAAFAAAGLLKLTQPRPALVEKGMDWADDMTAEQIKGIGAVELLGAIGLVAPAASGIAPVLTPVAGAGLVLIMGGAAAFHLKRGEVPNVATNVVLAAAAAFVVWGRFGPHSL